MSEVSLRRLLQLLTHPRLLLVGAAATTGELAACERRYHAFGAVAAQTCCVRVTAAFTGAVRVRKLAAPGAARQASVSLWSVPLHFTM